MHSFEVRCAENSSVISKHAKPVSCAGDRQKLPMPLTKLGKKVLKNMFLGLRSLISCHNISMEGGKKIGVKDIKRQIHPVAYLQYR